MKSKEKLKLTEVHISTNVLVVGAGPVSCTAAQELSRMGHHVLLCSPQSDIAGNPSLPGSREENPCDLDSMIKAIKDDARIDIIAPGEILELEGFPGEFNIRLKGAKGPSLLKEVGAVILANEPVVKTDFEAWGIKASNRVRTLSWVESALASPTDDAALSGGDPLKIVFLSGFTHHANPFTQKRAIEAALTLASKKENQVTFITEHFKVAHPGMERLTRRARDAGVLFVKLTGLKPKLENSGDDLSLSYYDETLEGDVTISPHLLFLEESYRPPMEAPVLAERLGINLDRKGFFQCENIYNQPIYTNRVGILVVGSAKGPVSVEEGMEEARAATMEVHQLLVKGKRSGQARIALDTKKCTICLTCYRLCPHRAISYLNRRPVFSDLACRVCGVCAAECPMDAIQIHDFTDQQIRSELLDALKENSMDGGEHSPVLVAFCCQNSAFEAARLALFNGWSLPEGLKIVKIPCAGRMDQDFLLTAFREGADGVMVIGCHHESCKSVTGNDLAEFRVEAMREYLMEAGLEEERLYFETLAPAMGSEFVKIAEEMALNIQSLGVSPIRKAKGQSR
ncbi:MAG: hydrogenase iron-sulfur subunit [Pseudomonadota bacterium]